MVSMNEIDKQFFDDMLRDCSSAYQIGSKVLGFIKNVRDEDYLFIFDDQAVYEYYKEKYKLYRMHAAKNGARPSVDFHIQQSEAYAKGEMIVMYQHKFHKILKGRDDIGFDILKEKNRYLMHLKSFVERQLTLKIRGEQKFWYHIYLGLSIIDNGSYDLTEEQKENANILHDKTPGERRDELIAWCKNKLGVEAPIEKQKEAE